MTTRRSGAWRCAALALSAAAWLSCGGSSPEPTVHFDLVAELPLSRQAMRPGHRRAEEPAAARAQGETLSIPAGRTVHYALEMPASARIVFEGVRPQGGPRGALEVSATPHGGESRVLARLEGESGRTELDWEEPEAQVVRLSLSVQKRQGAFLVRGPAVWVEGTGEVAPPPLSDRDRRRLRGSDRPNVLIYLIDSLRADRLGCYGYGKPVSPEIDAFAESALVFDNATANSSWTKSAVASIFTGLWPGSHRAITREDKLPEAAFTLAEALSAAGYATAGFSTNPSIAAEFGFDQGFEDLTLLSHEAYSAEVTDRAVEWLQGYEGGEPFFLYLHTLDPHDPYVPPAGDYERWSSDIPRDFAETSNELLNRLNRSKSSGAEVAEVRADLEALYDGEIASNDRAFGRVLGALEEAGRLDDTIVILVADHGEDFGEHRVWRHGQRLTRESLRIPLLIRLPGEHRRGREAGLVQQVDVLPTLLELLELDVPEWVEGESLLPLFVGGERPAALDPAFLYVRFSPPPRLGVLWRDWKLVSTVGRKGAGAEQLFHLATDPGELKNLARRAPVMRDFLAAMVARKLLDPGAGIEGEQTEIDRDTQKALRALGYIQ